MRVPQWTEEVIAEKVNQQFLKNMHLFPAHIDGEPTAYGKFVTNISAILVNSLDQIPGGFLLRMFLTDITLAALFSILGGAFTAGVLAERAGWFKDMEIEDHQKFANPLDSFSKS